MQIWLLCCCCCAVFLSFMISCVYKWVFMEMFCQSIEVYSAYKVQFFWVLLSQLAQTLDISHPPLANQCCRDKLISMHHLQID